MSLRNKLNSLIMDKQKVNVSVKFYLTAIGRKTLDNRYPNKLNEEKTEAKVNQTNLDFLSGFLNSGLSPESTLTSWRSSNTFWPSKLFEPGPRTERDLLFEATLIQPSMIEDIFLQK